MVILSHFLNKAVRKAAGGQDAPQQQNFAARLTYGSQSLPTPPQNPMATQFNPYGPPASFFYAIPSQPNRVPSQTGLPGAGSYRQEQSYPPLAQSFPSLGYQPNLSGPKDFWDQLITPQQTASPTLMLYLTALFNYVDQQSIGPHLQGGLSPEKMGRLAELLGFDNTESTYGLLRSKGASIFEIDSWFASFYTTYSFPYTMRPRAAENYLISNAPLLTLDGLVASAVFSFLSNPDREWAGMCSALASVQLLNARDGTPLPRYVERSAAPEKADPDSVERNRVAEQAMVQQSLTTTQQNAHNARILAQRADMSDQLMNRMRGDYTRVEYADGTVRYEL